MRTTKVTRRAALAAILLALGVAGGVAARVRGAGASSDVHSVQAPHDTKPSEGSGQPVGVPGKPFATHAELIAAADDLCVSANSKLDQVLGEMKPDATEAERLLAQLDVFDQLATQLASLQGPVDSAQDWQTFVNGATDFYAQIRTAVQAAQAEKLDVGSSISSSALDEQRTGVESLARGLGLKQCWATYG